MLKKSLISSLKVLLVFTVTLGLVYPLVIYLIGQLLFYDKANGSLSVKNGEVKGSFLIAQNFTGEKYFWPRPSSINFNPLPSGASNLGPTSKELLQQFELRKKNFIQSNFVNERNEIPSEMLFASASGVDPDISKTSAMLQFERVSKARNFDKLQKEKLHNLIDSLAEYPQFGIFGSEIVNVLKLNIKLDDLSNKNE